MRKVDYHIFKGMQRDASMSKQSAEFLWDAHNIRLTAREGDTLLSMTNERGTRKVSFVDGGVMVGKYVGHCVVGENLAVFTTNGDGDRIYRINRYDDAYYLTLLTGRALQLNFSTEHPLETLGFYESEDLQKVYWTDGVNQPRVINVCRSSDSYNANSFDFVQEVELNENVEVFKEASSSGQFPSGVIQYAFTYYNKNGQETNIFRTTPLLYTCYNDRAGSGEDKISNSFRIEVTGWDTHFDYLRVYSIMRTSLDATPSCKRVADIEMPKQLTESSEDCVGGSLSDRYYFLYASPNTTTVNFNVIEDRDAYKNLSATTVASEDSMSYGYVDFGELYDGVSTGADGNYYVLTKTEETKYMVIRAYDYGTGGLRYITWGENEKLYISAGKLAGAAGTWYRIVPEPGKSMLVGTSIKEVEVDKLIVVDNGTIGEDIDPTELLYVGGESVVADTLCQKDGTLFLGNVSIQRPYISEEIADKITYDGSNTSTVGDTVALGYRKVMLSMEMDSPYYQWGNTLNAWKKNSEGNKRLVNAAGFKCEEHYRLGVQFQYKTGKWSDPIWVKDVTNTGEGDAKGNYPKLEDGELSIPTFTAILNKDVVDAVMGVGYLRARTVAVFPKGTERLVQAQGVLTPTVYGWGQALNHTPDRQSSWFFRPCMKPNSSLPSVYAQYLHGWTLYGHHSRSSEIQGVPGNFSNLRVSSFGTTDEMQYNWVSFRTNDHHKEAFYYDQMFNVFAVDANICTFHSPEVEFDDTLATSDLSTFKCRRIGKTQQEGAMGDIDIETSSATVSPKAGGFRHKPLADSYSGSVSAFQSRLCSGLFYYDYLVDDNGGVFEAYTQQKVDCGFMVYPWAKTGSLNNDIARPTDKGNRSAVLKEKKLSNLLFFKGVNYSADMDAGDVLVSGENQIQVFDDTELQMVKMGDSIYYGNVDQLLNPVVSHGQIFGYAGKGSTDSVSFNTPESELWELIPDHTSSSDYVSKIYSATAGVCWWESSYPSHFTKEHDIGDDYSSLCTNKEPVRMKYKSTPHIVMKLDDGAYCYPGDVDTPDAYSTASNGLYLSLAEIYREEDTDTDFGGTSSQALQSNIWIPTGDPVRLTEGSEALLSWDYGDTWYQRYDCLKTYAYTNEDENQVVEIGSFLLETRVNLDGRYDRNRGMLNNLNMSPTNYNLINDVYSQQDNFFTYRIMSDDYYAQTSYPNVVTWSLEKTNGSDVDLWTRMTLGSTLDIDGTKGKIRALRTCKDTIYAFQDRSVNVLLFNSRVQVNTSDGVPIEISNSGKMDGARNISVNVGCCNKYAIAESPEGLYFVDSMSHALYNLKGMELGNVSDAHGFSHWFSTKEVNMWRPGKWTVNGNLANPTGTWSGLEGTALYYDCINGDLYVSTPDNCLCYSEKLGQFVSFESYQGGVLAGFTTDFFALTSGNDGCVDLWEMFKGEYNNFFHSTYRSDFTFISNTDATLDKTFTNLETRMDRYDTDGVLLPYSFMDTVRAWNEYQDTGEVVLEHKHYPYETSSVGSNAKRKFRIWRADIPRVGRQWVRNPWCKISLSMNVNEQCVVAEAVRNDRFELHDISVVYYT